jgi:hypothetical protein
VLTFSRERRRFGLKTTSSPKNPDFYDRTGNLEIVRRRSAFLTLIIENHFYGLESEHPQHGSFERVTSSSPWRNPIFLSGDSEEDEGRDGATERAAAAK